MLFFSTIVLSGLFVLPNVILSLGDPNVQHNGFLLQELCGRFTWSCLTVKN